MYVQIGWQQIPKTVTRGDICDDLHHGWLLKNNIIRNNNCYQRIDFPALRRQCYIVHNIQ